MGTRLELEASYIIPMLISSMSTLDLEQFTVKRHLGQFNQINERTPEDVNDYWADFNSHVIVVVGHSIECKGK